jgi:hypothetical protein
MFFYSVSVISTVAFDDPKHVFWGKSVEIFLDHIQGNMKTNSVCFFSCRL